MNNRLKEIVDYCEVRSKKEKLFNNRERMFKLNRLMSKLTFDRNVGLYAFMLDKYYALSLDEKSNKKELDSLAIKLFELEKLDVVLEYKKAREEYELISYYEDEYYKAINIDLRNSIIEYCDPCIYIFQGNGFKNVFTKEENTEVAGTVIYPFYEMKSNRDFRHLYNKVSFKYLECLSEDYSFDLKNKSLGRIKIEKL